MTRLFFQIIASLGALTMLMPAASAGLKRLQRCETLALDAQWRSEGVRLDLHRFNHILKAEQGYEVLMPGPEGAFRILRVRDLADAQLLTQAIAEPLNLAALIFNRAQDLPELVGRLERIVPEGQHFEISTRVKQHDSLKKKIFDKVRKKGAEFRIDQIDDIVGARIVAPGRTEAEAAAGRLRTQPGMRVLKYEPIRYERGYRATHVTIELPHGRVFEIQVMTRRMLSWVHWNAKRVYKPRIKRETTYFAKLKEYDRMVIDYLNALDEGRTMLPPKPDPQALGILTQDHFPAKHLR